MVKYTAKSSRLSKDPEVNNFEDMIHGLISFLHHTFKHRLDFFNHRYNSQLSTFISIPVL